MQLSNWCACLRFKFEVRVFVSILQLILPFSELSGVLSPMCLVCCSCFRLQFSAVPTYVVFHQSMAKSASFLLVT